MARNTHPFQETSALPFTQTQKVIIDTDPGVDDAVAILSVLGNDMSQVLGITCVRGNADLTSSAVNALKLLSVANRREIPVYVGTNYGLVHTTALSYWFGIDGFGDVLDRDPSTFDEVQKEHAAAFLARKVKEFPGEITILAIGPLTNIALAIHLNPDFLVQVKRVIILGGSVKGQGNSIPGVEFNFFSDPGAAAMVLDRAHELNTVLTLFPMDTGMENYLTLDWRWNSLGIINNSVVDFLNRLDRKDQAMHNLQYYIPYDAYAAGVFLYPDFIVSSEDYYGYVENAGLRSMGAMFIDYSNLTENSANLEVILDIDTRIMEKRMIEYLSNYT